MTLPSVPSWFPKTLTQAVTAIAPAALPVTAIATGSVAFPVAAGVACLGAVVWLSRWESRLQSNEAGNQLNDTLRDYFQYLLQAQYNSREAILQRIDTYAGQLPTELPLDDESKGQIVALALAVQDLKENPTLDGEAIDAALHPLVLSQEKTYDYVAAALIEAGRRFDDVDKALADIREELEDAARSINAHTTAEHEATRNQQVRIAGDLKEQIQSVSQKTIEAWRKSSIAPALVVPCLLGGWKEPKDIPEGPLAFLYGPPCEDRAVVDLLYDGDSQAFDARMREAIQLSDPPVVIEDGVWRVLDRLSLWDAIGPHIYDEHLDRFETLAEVVLGEPDPQFELSKDKRWAANVYGKSLPYSSLLIDGTVTTLALLGSRPEVLTRCRRGKAEGIAGGLIRKMLSGKEWQRWGSLDHVFPILAEASPEAFLNVIESTLETNPEVFDQLFAQEGNGFGGDNYMTGLWWSLEKLAWHTDYLVRVSSLLARFDDRDPGGNWANRPGNSLCTILTPWKPQTAATTEKHVVAVKVVLKEAPAAGWKLLLSLLPGGSDFLAPSQRPIYRSWTLPDEEAKILRADVNERYRHYSKLAVETSLGDTSRLADLVSRIDVLDKPDVECFVQHIISEPASSLQRLDRRLLWETAIAVIRRHERFPDADWCWENELIERLREIAGHLEPENLVDRHRHLFVQWASDFYTESDNYAEQDRRIQERRDAAVREVFESGGLTSVSELADEAECAYHVGSSYARYQLACHNSQEIAAWVGDETEVMQNFVSGFIGTGIDDGGEAWLDGLAVGEWPVANRVRLLGWLPFAPQTWKRAEDWLGKQVDEYWRTCVVNPYQHDGDFVLAINQLRRYARPMQALQCLHRMIDGDWFDIDLMIETLLESSQSEENPPSQFAYHVKELIERLQSAEGVDKKRLIRIEWLYLPLLERDRNGAAPKALEQGLADEPEAFCELICAMYRPRNSEKTDKETADEANAILVERSHRLMRHWITPPGTREDGSFDASACVDWYEKVLASLQASDREATGMHMAGQVLRHVPVDPGGLWLHNDVAELLNRPEMNELRRGFDLGIVNSRGCHFVAPDGSGEDALAKEWFEKADAVENAGYHRLATTLRQIASNYKREAEGVRREHRDE